MITDEQMIGLFAGLMLGTLLGWLAPALVCFAIVCVLTFGYYASLISSDIEQVDVIDKVRKAIRRRWRERFWMNAWYYRMELNKPSWDDIKNA